jgi:phosphate transport system ATP-binding protein
MNYKMECKRVSVYYGANRAIRDVTLGFAAHSVTALIGPSGCGKSTLLRALNRLHDTIDDARVEGEITLDGVNIYGPGVDPVDVRRRVGMVFQKSNPFPKSIFDNVALPLRLAGEKDRGVIQRRVQECLESAALWDEVRDRLGSSALGLSGGQQQRLCIARALAIEPEVILMDEPASALDPIATEAIEKLIGRLAKSYTIILVTHSLQQARRVSDRLAFFYLGDLVEHGRTTEVFDHPKQQKTADYLVGRFG